MNWNSGVGDGMNSTALTTIYGHLFQSDDLDALPEAERSALGAILDGQMLAIAHLAGDTAYTMNHPADGNLLIKGAVVAALSGGITLTNAGTLTIGASYPTPDGPIYRDALIAYATTGGIHVTNTGTLTVNGNLLQIGGGDLALLNTGGELRINGNIRLTGAGTITATAYIAISGDLDGRNITLSGAGTVGGHIRGSGGDLATAIAITGGIIGDATKFVAGAAGTALAATAQVTISGNTTLYSTVFGGGLGVTVAATTVNLGPGVTTATAIFGGGQNAQVGTGSGTAVTLNITGGSYQYLYGGGQNLTANADIQGDTNITVTGGNFLRLYGAGYHASVIGDTHLTIGNGTDAVSASGVCYGGGYGNSNITGTTNIILKQNSTAMQNIFSGGLADTGHVQNIANTAMTVNGATTGGLLYGGSLCQGTNGTSTVANSLITINSGEINGRVVGGGGSNGVNCISSVTNATINIHGGTFYSYIVGGGLSGNGTVSVSNVSLNITGGIFKNLVQGGGTSNGGTSKVDTTNVNISGGSFFYGLVGGGAGNTPTNSAKSDTKNVNITLNSSANTINWNNSVVYAGGNQHATVSGSTCITLTGQASKLVGLSLLSGGGLISNSVAGDKKLVFDNFNGELQSTISNFDSVTLTGNSTTILTGNQNLSEVNNWQLTADTTPTSALLDWGAGCTNRFAGDHFSLDISAFASAAPNDTQTLMQGAKAIFDDWHAAAAVTIGGVATLWDATLNGWKTTDLQWAVAVAPVSAAPDDDNRRLNLIKLA